jgi:hypothetical protein
MDCLATLDSGNYAYHLCRALERKGYVFEVISTPCQIARDGCGYCLKFPIEYKDLVINEGIGNNTPVRHMYSITPLYSKNRYDRIF